MNISRLIFGLFLVLIFVEIVLIAPKNLDDISMDFGPLSTQTEEDSNKIDQIMKGVHLVEASSSKKDWEFRGFQNFQSEEMCVGAKTLKKLTKL